MYDDDVRIRLAKPAEAEELTDIAWRSKGYWDYPSEVMSRFRGLLTIKQDFIEANPTYLIEHDDTGTLDTATAGRVFRSGDAVWLVGTDKGLTDLARTLRQAEREAEAAGTSAAAEKHDASR